MIGERLDTAGSPDSDVRLAPMSSVTWCAGRNPVPLRRHPDRPLPAPRPDTFSVTPARGKRNRHVCAGDRAGTQVRRQGEEVTDEYDITLDAGADGFDGGTAHAVVIADIEARPGRDKAGAEGTAAVGTSRRNGAGLLGVAGVVAVLGAAALVAAAIAALSLLLPVWAAATIVAVILFIVAAVMAAVSRKQVEQVLPPAAESIDSIKRDIDEIKEARR